MRPASTLAAYTGALVLVFGAALGIGSAVGPVGDLPAVADAPPAALPAEPLPGGLSVSQDGYVLQLATTTHPAGRTAALRFAVVGPDGARVTRFERTHDKDLHLVVVRRDLTGFQHLHPERDAQGRWSVPLRLPEPGTWKVVADFVPEGHDGALALTADVVAAGSSTPAPLPPPSRTALVDGYEVRLDGNLASGSTSRLAFTVRRDGRPVTDLAPYLGAYGHLVALRAGDLAYLHVHPQTETAGAGPELVFDTDVPAPAVHRLFLQFSHGGAVHTAAFTVTAAAGAAATSPGHSDGGHR